MGNCCGAQANEGEVSIQKGNLSTQKGYHSLFDEREVGGLKGEDKIVLIVRLQVSFLDLELSFNRPSSKVF